MLTHDDVLSRLRAAIPTLPDAFGADPIAPVRDVLQHGEVQTLQLWLSQHTGTVDRAAMREMTFLDICAWVEAAEASDADGSRSGGPGTAPAIAPRGSYQSANTTLRPVGERDLGALYQASLDPRTNHRWRFRGRTPSPEEFRRSVYDPTTLCQYVVITRGADQEPVGIVSAYDAELSSGHCYVASQRFDMGTSPGSATAGLMVEGMFVFFQYLFDHFTLDKLYLEVPEYNLDLFRGGADSLLAREGELKDHYYFGDRKWSLVILALYRTRWDELASAFRGAWPEGHFDGTAR